MASKNSKPKQGEIWLFDPNPVKGREIGMKSVRPCVIVSCNAMNSGASEMVIIVPMTTTNRKIPSHIEILPAEGGLLEPSYAIPEQIRSVSIVRLSRKLGSVSSHHLREIIGWINDLLAT